MDVSELEKVKAAIVNARRKKVKIVDTDAVGPIDFALRRHNELESYNYGVYHGKNALCLGTGRLGDYNIPGTDRMIFAARSPLWHGFYVSSMGGVGIELINAGLHYMSIEGKNRNYLLFAVKKKKKKYKKKFITLSKDELDDLYFRGCMGWRGIWAVEKYALHKLKDWFDCPFRIIATGPAALYTRLGALASTVLRDNELQFGQEDFAGRAALGSLAVQGHGVFAFAVGGDNMLESYNKENYEQIFKEQYDDQPWDVITSKTEKYRYVKDLDTGGTFGVNFTQLKDKTLMFNWNSTYWSYKKRMATYKKLITPYLNTFNEEIIKTKSWKTCGEMCPVVCKKIHITKKKDYEPYSACGPNTGVFNMMNAEEVVHRADTFCFDAIDFGTIASWILECLDKGLLTADDLGVEMKTTFDVAEYAKNPDTYSYGNALLIRHLANMMVAGHGIGKYAAEGLRLGAKALDKKFTSRTRKAKVKFSDLAVYVPFGKEGSLAPSQYWTPGLFAPVPIPHLSKTYYGVDIWDPKELGAKCAENYILELGIDELGICRFHRKWISKIAAKLADIDGFEDHTKELARRLIRYNKKAGQHPASWESRRVKEIVQNFLVNFSKMAKNAELNRWVAKFGNSLETNSKLYWNKMKEAFEEVVGEKE